MNKKNHTERFVGGCSRLLLGFVVLGTVLACYQTLNANQNKTHLSNNQKKVSRTEQFVMTLPEAHDEIDRETRLNILAKEWRRAKDIGDAVYAADLLRELRKEQAQYGSNTWALVEDKMKDVWVVSPIVLTPFVGYTNSTNSR